MENVCRRVWIDRGPIASSERQARLLLLQPPMPGRREWFVRQELLACLVTAGWCLSR